MIRPCKLCGQEVDFSEPWCDHETEEECKRLYDLLNTQPIISTVTMGAVSDVESLCTCREFHVEELSRDTRYAVAILGLPEGWTVTEGCPIHGTDKKTKTLS